MVDPNKDGLLMIMIPQEQMLEIANCASRILKLTTGSRLRIVGAKETARERARAKRKALKEAREHG